MEVRGSCPLIVDVNPPHFRGGHQLELALQSRQTLGGANLLCFQCTDARIMRSGAGVDVLEAALDGLVVLGERAADVRHQLRLQCRGAPPSGPRTSQWAVRRERSPRMRQGRSRPCPETPWSQQARAESEDAVRRRGGDDEARPPPLLICIAAVGKPRPRDERRPSARSARRARGRRGGATRRTC